MSPKAYAQRVKDLEEDIEDIKQTLAGNRSTKRGTLLLIELENKQEELRAVEMKRINNAPTETGRGRNYIR